jgi:L-2-hydroxycarboxylate dehydrogenase (NAD+)
MQISIKDLEDATMKALYHYWYSPKEAEIIKNILLFAQLRGNNQWVVKLVWKGIPRRNDDGAINIAKETSVSALVNGKKNHAMVVMDYATDLAIQKAKRTWISIVGNFNSSESTGALGYYVEKIARNGLIWCAFASSPFKTTAPFGSTEAIFCTNPIAYGIPSKNDPIILDFTTSQMAYYGLVQANIAGKTVEDWTGYDTHWNETNDPAQIMDWALKTFWGHRGSWLALIVQILAGPLVNAGYIGKDEDNAGNLLLAIDPNILVDTDQLMTQVQDIISSVKNSRKGKDVYEIFIPWERWYRHYHEAMANGAIEIDDKLWEQLLAIV